MGKELMKVLVLEDRPEYLAKLMGLLLAEEWEGRVHLTMTTSVQTAKTLIVQERWDLVFLDHDLPDGEGWDVLNAYRDHFGRVVDFPAYGVSSLPMHNKRLVAHGAVAYVAKMEGIEFIPKLREIVRQRLKELSGG